MRKHKNRYSVMQAVLVILGLGVLTFLAKHYEYSDIQVSHVEEVVIPGIENEYEFLFLADLHLAIKTKENLGGLGDADERMAGFVNLRGTTSEKQLPQWMEYANQERVDAVLLGGDMIDYYSDENADYLKNQIDRLAMPYLFTLGNHDLFSPWDEQIPDDSVLYTLFQENNTAFQVLDYEEFAICAIDNEAYDVNGESLAAMKKWLEINPEKPVILLAHVPFYTENDRSLLETSVKVWGQPLVIGTGEGTRDTTAVSREFMDLIFDENSLVVAIFTGDNHFYHKGNLKEDIVQWVGAPAYGGEGMIIRVKGS